MLNSIPFSLSIQFISSFYIRKTHIQKLSSLSCFSRKVPPPKIVLIHLLFFTRVIQRLEFSSVAVLPTGQAGRGLMLTGQFGPVLLFTDSGPLHLLLLELHFIIKEILITEEPIQDSLDISHPLERHLHL